MPWAKNVYWLYSILIDPNKAKISRDELSKRLEKEGIETRKFFYPLHEMPIYAKYGVYSYPVATTISRQGLNLPSSTKLTEEDARFIAQKIKEIAFT
jgi:perosamine synthetase